LAVNTAEVATPELLVTAVVTPPANVPLAPLAGAANVTVTPPTGLPPESRTVATRGAANAVLIGALCGVPLVAVIDAATPGVTVTLVLPDVKPDADAVMVAIPALWPFTWGCEPGVLAPAGIRKLDGEAVAFAGSLLVRVTVTPPAGAGTGNVTGSAADSPARTVTSAGTLIGPKKITVTLAVVSGRYGSLLA
jgi:hypothetical protein